MGSMPSCAIWKPYLANNVSVKPIYNLLWCQVSVTIIILHAIASSSVLEQGPFWRRQACEPCTADSQEGTVSCSKQ